MKKIVGVLLTIALMISLCGCQLLCNHDWKEATCTTPRTCSKCGKTEGDPIGHSGTEFTLIETNYNNAIDKSVLKCDLCGEILEDKEEPSTTFINDGFFGFTCKEFVERLQKIYDDNYGCDGDLYSLIKFKYEFNDNGLVVFKVYMNDLPMAYGFFADAKGSYLTEEDEDVRIINKIALYTPSEDIGLEYAYYVHEMIADCISMTIDPTIESDKFLDAIFSNTYAKGERALHNIFYTLGIDSDDRVVMQVEIDVDAYA